MSCIEPPTTIALEKKVAHHISIGVQAQLAQFFCPVSRRILLIAGPTGVGKTNLSLKLAKRLNGEIVSADSMQVYKGMDIGTAKVSFEERQLIPHHLIDICDIDEPFNVSDYFEEAKAAIDSILSRGKVPIVVGGTGFYLHALMYGPPLGPPSDKEVRERLEKEMQEKGSSCLYERLVSLDPEYAQTIQTTDPQKISRALEIIELSGKKVSDFHWKERETLPIYDYRAWFLYLPREILYPRLNERCDHMLETGLLDEVVELDKLGIRKNPTARNAIGYRQSLQYLDTARTQEDYKLFVDHLKTASRHLAKRQYTWFRKEKCFTWVDMTNADPDALIERMVVDFYS